MGRRTRSIWESLIGESTEGPTVTVSLPRELAQELVGVLMGSLELDGGGDHEEPDLDDFGGPPDYDEDDDPLAALIGGDGLDGAGDDSDSDDDDSDDDDEGPRPKTAVGEHRRRR